MRLKPLHAAAFLLGSHLSYIHVFCRILIAADRPAELWEVSRYTPPSCTDGNIQSHHVHDIAEKRCTVIPTNFSTLLLVACGATKLQGFIQDLLCGRGAAQALYLWMTVPQESHFPVLHATSLATQGQGWGSYQSLSSRSVSDQQETESIHRRRRSRALPSDVDAATRALVAVMIKSNGALTEAATFAR